MDPRPHGLLISTVGFIYASTGFALSLIGTLLGIFIYTEPNPELQKNALVLSRGRRKTKEQPQEEKKETPSTESTSNKTQIRGKPTKRSRIGPHRRSKSSIPIITIHHPESNGTFSATIATTSVSGASTAPVLHSEPLEMTESSANTTLPSLPLPPTNIHQPGTDTPTPRQKFRFATLKATWTEKKPKLARCISSPDLSPASPQPPMPLPRKSTSNDQMTSPKPALKWRSKSLQRTPSAPSGSPSKKDRVPCLKVEKKRSQPLPRARTQPYEAPYFFPPPVPVLRRSSEGGSR